MNFLKNRKTAAAVLLCAMLAASQTAMALEGQAANSWTAPKLNAVQTAETSFVEGTVEEFAVDEQGRTVWLLRRTGDDDSAPLIHVAVTNGTKMETESGVANGSIIGVEYRGEQGAVSIVADRVTKQEPLPQVIVTGEVIELMAAESPYNGLLMRELSDDPATALEYMFRWDPQGEKTKVLLADGEVSVGDRITITYNGILTRSLPPQGFAQIISDAAKPAR